MSKQKKRKRARVQIAVDEQGKPVYKWANGYTKAELEASKTKIRIEYGVDQMIKFPVIKKESPPENKCETFSAYASRWLWRSTFHVTKGAYMGKNGITRDRTGKPWYYRNSKR